MRTGEHNELIEIFGVYYENKSLKNFDNLREIISGPAYKDMTPRHLKGIGKKPDDKNKLFDKLAGEFLEYFEADPPNSEEEFDDRHSRICNDILVRLKDLCDKNVKVHYGKAQKLVNMAFKNFYCFYDAEDYEKKGYFDHCHMPLDSFTLSWFKNTVDDSISVDSWSSMESGIYSDIQTEIRKYFDSERNITYRNKNGDSLTPFTAEFYIWEEMRFPALCEKWINKAVTFLNCISFDEDITNRLEKICDTANELLKNGNCRM
ncbi:MAG: hypothetical protein ACI4HN_01760 [Ruminococcus sp.]